MVNTNYKILLILFCLLAGNATAKRLQIRSVGSTTVYPFSVEVAKNFSKNFNKIEPFIEGTGTGQGMAVFCGPTKHNFSPDIVGASRKIKESEITLCQKNGVGPILEVPFGYDGIVLSVKKGSKNFNITLEELFLAMAKQVPNKYGKLIKNPYKKWRDINPKLPNIKIQLLLPQVKNGTYESFLELVMDKGCATNKWIQKIKESNPHRYEKVCNTYRQDSDHVIIATKYDLGDSHDLFVQKINDNPGMLGIMGYSFIKKFKDKIQAITIGGVAPSFDSIASQDYPLSRPLYIYARKDRLRMVDGLQKFINFYQSSELSGNKGTLINQGLVPFNSETMPNIQTIG